MIEKMWFMS